MALISFLHFKYPLGTSGQLSWARSRAVCNSALAWVGVTKLGLHNLMLLNNIELAGAINDWVPKLQEFTADQIILEGWKCEPPKPLADVFESVIGAVFVDSAWNYEKVEAVVREVMDDILNVLTPVLPRDSVSRLMVFAAKSGCKCMTFQ